MYGYSEAGIRPGEIFNCNPAAMFDGFTKADYMSSESGRSSDIYRFLEEIIEKNLISFDVESTLREFGDFRPVAKRQSRDIKRREELNAGDTSSLDDFIGEFRVIKGVDNV